MEKLSYSTLLKILIFQPIIYGAETGKEVSKTGLAYYSVRC